MGDSRYLMPSGSYCVGGACAQYFLGIANPFPTLAELANYLVQINPKLGRLPGGSSNITNLEAQAFAARIISLNDAEDGDFDSAWNVVLKAIQWRTGDPDLD